MTKIQPVNTATLGICFATCANICEMAIHGSPVVFIFLHLQLIANSLYHDYFILFQVTKSQIHNSAKKD